MKRFLSVLFVVLMAFSASARNYKWETDIFYKGKPDAYTEKMCRLDVAYEEGSTDRPVIVWFHGGGLTEGWRHIPETLLRDGAIVVGVGYRFVTEVEGLKVGDTVEKGEVIATVAEATGDEYKDGAHLHFEMLVDGENVDPSTYLTMEEK